MSLIHRIRKTPAEYLQEFESVGFLEPGYWCGSKAEELGLEGVLDGESYGDFLNAQVETAALVASGGAVSGGVVDSFCLTLEAPKSVSCMWVRADESLRESVDRLQTLCAVQTVKFLEQHVGPLLCAMFDNCIGENDNPHLHTNVYLFSIERKVALTEDQEEFVGAYYRAGLAYQLRKLGFSARRVGNSFEIEGVPDEVIQCFSLPRDKLALTGADISRATVESSRFALTGDNILRAADTGQAVSRDSFSLKKVAFFIIAGSILVLIVRGFL